MTTKEAIEAMMNGKKVRSVLWTDLSLYIYFSHTQQCFMTESEEIYNFKPWSIELIDQIEWEITIPCLTTSEAMQALLNGQKLTRDNWGRGIYIYMKDNKIIDDNENEDCFSTGNCDNYIIYEENK